MMQNSLSPIKQQGFTLIELMITITVLMLILFMGSALTRSWVDRSQVNSASSALKSALTQAKSAALRNTDNHSMLAPAVSLCIDSTTPALHIVRNKVSTATPCTMQSPQNNIVLQSIPLAKGISIKQEQTNIECLSFNPAGIIATMNSSCSTNTTLSFTVEKNNETADITIM